MALINCSECHAQISSNAASCPHCGNPNSSIATMGQADQSPISTTSEQMTVDAGGNLSLWHVFIAGIVGIFFFAYFSAHSSGSGSTNLSRSKVKNPEGETAMAFFQCKDFVKERLKAPTTAEFSDDFTTSKLVDNQLVIKSYVDAQNSFGAKLRNNFLCTVKWNGANDANTGSWDLVSIQMDEQ